METTYKHFSALTPHELYAILQLRSEVFVIEQQCFYLDADDKDQDSYHIMMWENDLLAGYTRLLPAGVSYDTPSIGRVVIAPKMRAKGIGRVLMRQSIDILYSLWGKTTITIGAQYYLRDFYSSLGFRRGSDIYLEDGIEHIKMFLTVVH
jgi:ElaA protein